MHCKLHCNVSESSPGAFSKFRSCGRSTDAGRTVTDLELIISTGNDDLRGGSNWANWTDHTVRIPLPGGGLHGGDVRSVKLHTGFGGGMGSDNWNVQRIQLKATLR